MPCVCVAILLHVQLLGERVFVPLSCRQQLWRGGRASVPQWTHSRSTAMRDAVRDEQTVDEDRELTCVFPSGDIDVSGEKGRVTGVLEGGHAAKCGVQIGSIFKTINGERFTYELLQEVVASSEPCTVVFIKPSQEELDQIENDRSRRALTSDVFLLVLAGVTAYVSSKPSVNVCLNPKSDEEEFLAKNGKPLQDPNCVEAAQAWKILKPL